MECASKVFYTGNCKLRLWAVSLTPYLKSQLQMMWQHVEVLRIRKLDFLWLLLMLVGHQLQFDVMWLRTLRLELHIDIMRTLLWLFLMDIQLDMVWLLFLLLLMNFHFDFGRFLLALLLMEFQLNVLWPVVLLMFGNNLQLQMLWSLLLALLMLDLQLNVLWSLLLLLLLLDLQLNVMRSLLLLLLLLDLQLNVVWPLLFLLLDLQLDVMRSLLLLMEGLLLINKLQLFTLLMLNAQWTHLSHNVIVFGYIKLGRGIDHNGFAVTWSFVAGQRHGNAAAHQSNQSYQNCDLHLCRL